jgi:hypothetical protein
MYKRKWYRIVLIKIFILRTPWSSGDYNYYSDKTKENKLGVKEKKYIYTTLAGNLTTINEAEI